MNPENIRKLLKKGYVLQNEPMSKHTSFQVGGPARVFAVPFDMDEAAALIRYLVGNGLPYFVLGNGTNLLVSDEGYDGVVIHMGKVDGSDFVMLGYEETPEGFVFDAGAGCTMASLGNIAQSLGCSGFEALGGIPGCIGGAVMMNAGCYGSEMKDIVRNVTVISKAGQIETILAEDMDFSYRHSALEGSDSIIARVEYLLPKGNSEQVKMLAQEYMQKRRDKQPLNFPSAGSTFKRPEGYYAGALIEGAGLKGYTEGGAQVSEKHAGFVINKGSATAKDIYRLIRHIQNAVYENAGVRLEPEVRFLGVFDREP